jgi:hypothetical protein
MEAERRKRKWWLEDLVHFARVPSADVSRYELGRRPIPIHAKRLAKVLDLEPEQLIEVVASNRSFRK